MINLKEGWRGKSIFYSAFQHTLPLPTPLPSAVQADPVTPTSKSAPRVRRGKTIYYTAGPARRSTKYGTWTHYMVRTILEHTDTSSAEQAHRASGQYAGKKLDFGWMFKNNLITKA